MIEGHRALIVPNRPAIHANLQTPWMQRFEICTGQRRELVRQLTASMKKLTWVWQRSQIAIHPSTPHSAGQVSFGLRK